MPNHNNTFKQDMQGCYKKWRQLDKKTLATWHYECDEQRCQWEQNIVNVRCNNKKIKKQIIKCWK